METAPIRMSPTGFKAFVEVLSRPARPVPEMVELFQRATPWESGEAKAVAISKPALRPANQAQTAIVRHLADKASRAVPAPKDRRAARTRRLPC
jgi:hypothetical protein